MLGWQSLNHKAIVVGLGLMLLMVATNVEAGVFGWLKGTEMQWSPEVKGVITSEGEPVAGLEVKRYLYRGDKKHQDIVKTAADGSFYFPRKILRVRSHILYEIPIGIQVFVLNYPVAGEDDQIFRVYGLNDLNYKSIDLVLSGMHCELSASHQSFELKNLEIPGNSTPSMGSKCTFTHADKALYSEAEVQEMLAELESQIEEIDIK
ncbi:hypothetical protein Q3O60_02570 [Alkalimonas collagenimarina]|uniref:DUF6795 domain-containing protein n=1 Tax=Alkalimonas collagenimarina TaxID=400390 RepID=A0ABT9GVJ6_9GAMM|nr:DUF6795 domain-containing protein [Alkalimonas collagenimarina]MDP4535069.1 hypothetical protein [Alkalimonas collagenimarina]